MQMLVSQIPIISGLDDQSKFQMFTVFSGRHIGVPRMYTNMANPYLVSFAAAFWDVTQRSPQRSGCSHPNNIPFPLFLRSAEPTNEIPAKWE